VAVLPSRTSNTWWQRVRFYSELRARTATPNGSWATPALPREAFIIRCEEAEDTYYAAPFEHRESVMPPLSHIIRFYVEPMTLRLDHEPRPSSTDCSQMPYPKTGEYAVHFSTFYEECTEDMTLSREWRSRQGDHTVFVKIATKYTDIAQARKNARVITMLVSFEHGVAFRVELCNWS
jgi:hypothetical protein